MRSIVQRHDDGLAICIPDSIATELRLVEGSVVELSIVGASVIVSPASRSRPSLDELMRGVTDENRHREWDVGPPVGREIW